MNDADLLRQLTAGNAWWRDTAEWELDDPDLRRLRDTPLDYEPDPLHDIVPDGLYVLRGPRRVGKSVEVKRTISRLISRGVSARRIIHFACDGLSSADLRRLARVGRDQATRQVGEPRYWFLDEITSVDDWPDVIKWLRDNSELSQDCVVLTGSSQHDLEEARKALAGRRGSAADSDRLLLPMSFRAFCAAQGLNGLPDHDPIRPRDFLGLEAESAVYELMPWLDDLVSLWEVYCRVGGFPRAVTDSFAHSEVSTSFVDALWEVIHGDALAVGTASSSVQSLHLMVRLSKNLASPVNMTAVAEDIGVRSHHTAKDRITGLTDAYLAWPCYQRGDHQMPNLRAQEKVYLTDPLLARIAHLRAPHLPAPDTSKISEQQIGLALTRHLAGGDSSRYADFTNVMYTKSATGQEVDFCGRTLGIAFEGKYSDEKLRRESQTMRTMFGGGVLATRSKLADIESARAVPAAFLAYLLSR